MWLERGSGIVEKDTRNRAWTTSIRARPMLSQTSQKDYWQQLIAVVSKKVETFVDDVERIGRIGTI